MDGSAFPASGPSVMSASVVSSNEAIDAACCSATRSTLVGSMIPACSISTYSLVSASKPRVIGTMALTLSTTTEPSSPAFSTIWRIGSSRARRTMLTPVLSSPESLRLSRASDARSSATPPPGTIPSSTAARVALRASSTRAFFSFISVSLAAGQGRDVLEHGLATIAEARRLDGAAGERPAQLVHHQGRQGLTLQVLGDDEQRLARPGNLLEQRQHVLHHAELLLVDEDEGVLQHHFHALRIRHEIGGEVPAVELHSLDDVEGGLHRLGLFDGDDPVLADLLHRFRDQAADRLVVVGRDRGDLGDLLLVLGGLGHVLQLLDHHGDGLLDAALQGHRVRAGRHVPEAAAEDGLGQHSRRRRAVARDVGGLGRDFLQHLGAHVLAGVLELDLLGDGDAVLGEGGAAELLGEDDVPPLRTERHLDGVRHDVDAAQERGAGFLVEQKLLGHGYFPPECARTPRMSSSFMMRNSSPSSLISLPEYLPKRIRSPCFTSSGWFLPSSVTRPVPTATILPSCGFSLAVSGMMMLPCFSSPSARRLTSTRSWSGRNVV